MKNDFQIADNSIRKEHEKQTNVRLYIASIGVWVDIPLIERGVLLGNPHV